MPLLASAIVGIFGSLVGFFAKWLTKRVAIVAAAVAALVVATTAFVGVVEAAWSGLAMVMPQEVVTGASWIVPDNITAVLAVYSSAKLARWAYDWNTRIISMKLGV